MSSELNAHTTDKPVETTTTAKPDTPPASVPGTSGVPLPTTAYYDRAQHETRDTLESQQAASTTQGTTAASKARDIDGAGTDGSGKGAAGNGNGGSPADLPGRGTADGRQDGAVHAGQDGNQEPGNENTGVSAGATAPADEPGAGSPPGGDSGVPVTGTDGGAADASPEPASAITPDQDQDRGGTGPDKHPGPELTGEADPGPVASAPGADGAPGRVDTDTGVIDGNGHPGPADGQDNNGLQGSPGPAGRGADTDTDTGTGTVESGEQDGDTRTAPGRRPGTEVSQESRQGEAEDKGTEQPGENIKEQGSKDQPLAQLPPPDAEPGRQGDRPPEVSPDRNADDPVAAFEQRMLQALERRDAARDERDAAREAGHKAEIDQLKAESQATADRIDELETRHEEDQAQIRELKARLEPAPDAEPDSGKDPDQVKAEQQRSDRLPQNLRTPGDESDPLTSPDEEASLTIHEAPTREATDVREAKPPRRRAITAENVGLAGTLVGAANTVAEFAMHATPDGIVGLGTLAPGLASLGLAKIEKRRKEKNDHPDQRQTGEGTP